jgi:peptidoglycan/LPS O-acetylase OafA/YrhL
VRALAVLAVMGFHEGASELSGGFLGVDIFFVLSGFLITDLLVTRYDTLGRLDLRDFWTRRARRLLPALAVMLVVVTAAASVIEPAQEVSLRPALLAAVTYTSNWYQILHHVSYFAAFSQLTAPAPLDHLWSLAIEEQFYLLWPLILWFLLFRLNGRRSRVTVILLAAAASALVMALQYTPGGDPSGVYYGTDTHASALLIGAALALAYPLASLGSLPAAQTKRLDAAGVAGLAVLAWAIGHFSGNDPAVYPVGLIVAALAAACLVAAAAGNGVIAVITSLPTLRWVGVRSYGMYLWHWPVIALAAALAGSGPTSAWTWLIETGITIALAAASWRFIETPILQNGLRTTIRHWRQQLADIRTRPADARTRPADVPTGPADVPTGPADVPTGPADVPTGPADVRTRSAWRRRGSVPVAVASVTVIAVVVAVFGVVRPSESATPPGLLRQVAEGQRISSASQSGRTVKAGAHKPTAASSPSAAACRPGQQPKVSGDQVTAVGDSIMVASAAALNAAMPGIYIDAQVGRQMQSGLAAIQDLAAAGTLRHIVVIGLGTNGDVTASQIRQLRQAIGPNRDLVLVNTFGPMPWEHEVNAELDAAARQGGNVELANWNQAIAADPSLLWPDGIHPQPSGAKLYARVVLVAARAALSRAQPSSCKQPRTH